MRLPFPLSVLPGNKTAEPNGAASVIEGRLGRVAGFTGVDQLVERDWPRTSRRPLVSEDQSEDQIVSETKALRSSHPGSIGGATPRVGKFRSLPPSTESLIVSN